MNPVELNDLAKLLDFGAKCLGYQNLNVLKMRGAKKMFFAMLVAAHNYTEGVYSLCRENRSHPCFSLLRSLCENLINVNFLYCFPLRWRKTINSSTRMLRTNEFLKDLQTFGILKYREAIENISFLLTQQKRNNIFSLRTLRLERSGR